MKITEKTFTHDFMKKNCGCYEPDELMACSFMKSETVTAESILNSEIPTKDKYWFFCKKVFSKEQNQRIAISCAKSVLHLYENKYPDDKRVRNAIEAAEKYLAGKITREELMEARRAATAAYAYAAAVADDAYAAATAAYAYAAAVAAYADDAYAAAYAAAYAYAAADAAADALKKQLLDNLVEFCKENELA